MSYSLVLGDLGPVMPMTLTDNGVAAVLDAVNDTVALRYIDPAGTTHQIACTITSAATGQVQAAWTAGELPLVGVYKGQVVVTRANSTVFPQTFPKDGSFIIWNVYPSFGSIDGVETFNYTATGLEGSDFMVTMPAARTSSAYNVFGSCGLVKYIVGLEFPNTLLTDRTTTQFRVITTAALTAGDVLAFEVRP